MTARKKKPVVAASVALDDPPDVDHGFQSYDLDIMACCMEARTNKTLDEKLEEAFAAAKHWVGTDGRRLEALKMSVKYRPGACSFSYILERAETIMQIIEPKRGRKRKTTA